MIAILLIVNACVVWKTDKRLESRIAAIRAAGEPITLADLAGDPIPADQNAATFLRRAEDDLLAIEVELGPVYTSGAYEQRDLDPAHADAIASALEAYPELIGLLERAAACPDYAPAHDYTLPPEAFLEACLPAISDNRSIYRTLQARLRLQLARGDPEGAMQTSLLMLRLCRHLDREPMIVGSLVGLACRAVAISMVDRVLRAGPVSEEAHRALEEELARYDATEAFRWGLITDRAYGLDSFRMMPTRRRWPLRAYWNWNTLAYLDLFDSNLSLAGPYSEVRSAVEANDQAAGRAPVMVRLVAPAVAAFREAAERVRAQTRCLRVLNALTGEAGPDDPEALDISQLGLPADATTDPMSGRPLIVRRLPEGWIVYSVGRDLRDGGGALSDYSDWGLGPQVVWNDDEPDEGSQDGSR